ncbi:MAG: hypothetical protein JWQ54_4116 [Mucilaginibacter sp.]|nr:hypothetical protein [Mucilaginibacter sp.]
MVFRKALPFWIYFIYIAMNLDLYIVLQKPPANVDFGLQKGHGSKYETIQIQRSGMQDLHFNLTIEVKGDKQKDDLPGFAGPFVQGVPLNKFIYIDIGTFAGQESLWSRRLKIPLTGITWDLIDQAASGLETYVPGTAKGGGPNCATVKPFEGWKVKTP